MDKERLKELAENSDFIEGIYNYCDRWCERCPNTSKCMVYATEQEELSDSDIRDMDNEKFWQQLSGSFQLAMEMLEDFAEQEGIELEDLDVEGVEEDRRVVREKAETHPAARSAGNYGDQVNEWFESSTGNFENIEEALFQKIKLGLAEEDIKREAEDLRDMIEIIRWYQYQIHVKIMRALQGEYDDFDLIDPVQNDANGSAKVALLGIERSTSAWGRLMNLMPEQEDDILDLLVLLKRTEQNIESAFPDVRAFQRPGFDD